ncbi:MAG TPA: BlaI/MecI/CopY family transcriptional regulator [Verrucomicrobiae bacterium]|jgi:BlaI family penicillinase repressor|nr:BlaI/MecI/CopY family transcriptional regulator [Verrucomicrobiae bacterium]
MTLKRAKVLPTRSELRILHALWDLGQATVEEVTRHRSFARRPNYKTTQTLLRIMEQKRLVRHLLRGRVFLFVPCVTREEIGKVSVRRLLEQNFGGSPAELLVNLLESASVDEAELEELESLIRKYREQTRNLSGNKGNPGSPGIVE